MIYYAASGKEVLKSLSVNENKGLSYNEVDAKRKKFGANVLTEKKQKSFVNRLIGALLEPMMLILLIAFIITAGVNIGKYLKTGKGDFYECLGIFIAIAVSVILTVVMEGKSQKAFSALSKFDKSAVVKVKRDGEIKFIKKEEIVVGDIVFLEAGNKIPADGRLISCVDFETDESTLTGESLAVKKKADCVLGGNALLGDRINCVYAGTYVSAGEAIYVVTAVGDNGEIGKIAENVSAEKSISAPLNEKLKRLGKMVSVFGIVSSLFVFILSFVKLALSEKVTFDGVQNLFIESIVLIVAAVPEGLPTTVAISLTLNVLRLAKSNALIKKLVATETVGCVSVICTDKTGTLTKNKMSIIKVVTKEGEFLPDNIKSKAVVYNAAVNSTAEITYEQGKVKEYGSSTELALLSALKKSGYDYKKIRKKGAISPLTPFSSRIKYMETVQTAGENKTIYLKGAPEVVLDKCLLSEAERKSIIGKIKSEQESGARVIAFASSSFGAYGFDGFAVIADGLRDDVKESVLNCRKAGIAVKMLTGDNKETARRIALEAGLSANENEVVTADYIEKLDFNQLKKEIQSITVIARSTPSTKLKVVTALQSSGEVVAVTGDGVNDAPAIKHADIGIAMGDGSEITKQASDVVLLDNSFSTILKAISFGRNVYSNFQRFIMFQLTVNLASMTIIIASLLTGLDSPFSSTCLLWLNIIMDGPLALSLGLEMRRVKYLSRKPVKRSDDILNNKILLRIGLHSLFMCLVVTAQRFFNFLNVDETEQLTVVITMFVFFQVFNAVNCREVTSESAFKGITQNKLLIFMIILTYFLHIAIITFLPEFFGTVKLDGITIIKISAVCASIVAFSEIYKFIYRKFVPFFKRENKRLCKFSINEKRSVT